MIHKSLIDFIFAKIKENSIFRSFWFDILWKEYFFMLFLYFILTFSFPFFTFATQQNLLNLENINTNYIQSDSFSIVEDIQLSLDIVLPSHQSDNDNSETLGQVFTLPKIAAFMANLLKKINIETPKILDPCIGPNTFPEKIQDIFPNAYITGVELDSRLVSKEIRSFYASNNRKLVEGSFFDLATQEKFDAIIQNPPYVRHELLRNGANSKENIVATLSASNITIPSKSNLYIYFLLKSLLHLNEGGKLVAITYDSWLYSDFGLQLKKILLRFGQIEAIYHFKKNAFPDANVGATIIEFTKKANSNYSNHNILYYQFETPDCLNINNLIPTSALNKVDFLKFKGNIQTILDFKNSLFCNIAALSTFKPFRGVGTIANNYFIFEKPCFDATIPFVKDIVKIKSMTVFEPSKYLLSVNGHQTDDLKIYLAETEKAVKNNPKLLTLNRAIAQKSDWYRIEKKPVGNIIFNYYLRNNIDFILNINNLQVSDNFYVLNISDENLYAVFAILNSSFSKIALLENSRNQGSGLRKIQVFEFLKVPIINPSKIDAETLNLLKSLGGKLSKVNRFEDDKNLIINEIDNILLAIYNKAFLSNLSPFMIQEEYKRILKN
jgi:adenine-specific DNA-methyltransferase